jgi:aspartyl-tRNA(Asn)/glutamyl-tRNA(Gln) amidotransferase subunit A
VNELCRLGARELLRLYGAGDVSPVEVVDALSARIEAVDALVGGFTTVCLDRARDEAAAAEQAWRRGQARPLEGVPFAAKDLFDSAGVRTTYGSPMFAEHVPQQDATAVARARAAGAVLLGKTQTHEFAWGISSVNELMGSTHNPWAPDRISGGSSGGSAVALAADEVPLALGSDTGGSIRVPSALCGTIGLKPTYGRVSLAGAWPLAHTLDHPGPMARTPADAALLLDAIVGVDLADPSAQDVPLVDLHTELGRGPDGLRVGLCPDLELVELAPHVRDAFDAAARTVADAGAELVEVELPEAPLIYPAFGVIQRAEALSAHRRAGLYPARRSEYGADVLGRLDLATEVSLDDYLAASGERQRARSGFARLFRHCDVLLTPVGAGSPFPDASETGEHLGAEISFRDLVMPYTTPQNLCGLPACTVRAGFDPAGVPIGVQFSGPPWGEAPVLRAAQGLFDATPDVQAARPTLPR